MAESQFSDDDVKWFLKRGAFWLLAASLLALGGCYGVYPWLRVWEQHMEGKALLAKSEYAKKVMVQDAIAREEAAKSLAQAEVTRAEGVAKANRIIGQSLENNREYLHYLWIHNLEEGNHDVIYVPTEAGLPIFEAGGRFQKQPRVKPAHGEPGTTEHPEARPSAD